MTIETISIKEYAILCNISKQAVYKRLNTSLEQYCVKVFNPKGRDEIRLKMDVLSEEQRKEYEILFKEKSTIVEDSTDNKKGCKSDEKRKRKTKDDLNAEAIEIVKKQLAQKMEEITFLREQITAQEQNVQTLKDIILMQKTQHEQSQAFISQQQSIIAEQQQTIAQLAQKSTETAQEATPDEVPIENTPEQKNGSEEPKNGFVARIKKWWNEL